MTKSGVLKELAGTPWGKPLRIFRSTTSTMDWGHRMASKKPSKGALILAEVQSHGRGRRGRTWKASLGHALLFSVVLEFPVGSKRASLLTLAAGLSICRALEPLGVEARIRWPNDIVVNGSKVAGILAEAGQRGAVQYVILGIGLNVYQDARELKGVGRYGATSLLLEKARIQGRVHVLGALLRAMGNIMGPDLLLDGHRGWMRGLRSRSIILGRMVRVQAEGRVFRGRAKGFGKDGELLVLDSRGQIRHVYSGDVSYS